MKCVVLLALIYGVVTGPVEDDALKEFSKDEKFISGVYKELLKKETGNFIVSPLSVRIILALTNEGARGETSTEIVTALNLPSPNEKIQRAIKALLPQLTRDDDKLQLLSANRIYTGKGVQLEDDFKSISANIYGSGVESVDFGKPKEAAKTINSWVEDHTNNKIKDLLKPDVLNNDVKLALVNALYFNGKWTSKFQERGTRKKKFFNTKTDSVEVDTMHQLQYFNYYENPTLNAKFLELPYKGGDNINMIIVLPNEKEGLRSLEQNIEPLLAPQPLQRQRVDVQLPRFAMDTTIEFIPILEELGIKKLFAGADLTGLSKNHKDLFVSYIVQKVFVNVTESGTEAAAATAVLGSERSGHFYQTSVDFHADHPFLYLIEKDGLVLFIGRYTNS